MAKDAHPGPVGRGGGVVPQGVSNTSNEAFLPPAGGTRSAIGSITRGPHPSFISKQGQQHFPESS